VNKWKIAAIAQAVIALIVVLGACATVPPEAEQIQAEQSEQARAGAVAAVGMPAITNYTEMRFAKDLYELRDEPQATFMYLHGNDGSLRCFGEGIGYGLPYGVQFTNPEMLAYASSWGVATMPQAEPNGLHMPDNAEATWVQMKAPDGSLVPIYVEPRMVISPFPLPCKPLDQ
jgi:hypothetical protein